MILEVPEWCLLVGDVILTCALPFFLFLGNSKITILEQVSMRGEERRGGREGGKEEGREGRREGGKEGKREGGGGGGGGSR